jgi:hypothetical protein
MLPASDRLREYLAAEELLVAVFAATLHQNSVWKAASIGVTDRRILCVSEDGEVVTVGYDSICTIRSRQRTTRAFRENDSLLLLGSGTLAAILGLVGVVVLATDIVAPLLVLVIVGGFVLVEYLRRNVDEIQPETILEGAKESLARTSMTEAHISDTRAAILTALTIGATLVAAVGLVGVVFASGRFAILSIIVLLGGIALVSYAYWQGNDFDDIELVRRHETEVSISTDDGRMIHIRSDSSEELTQQLNRLAYTDHIEPDRIDSTRS